MEPRVALRGSVAQLLFIVACKAATPVTATAPPPKAPVAPAASAVAADISRANGFTAADLPLPGGGADGIAMDYLAYNPRTKTVWVPAGNTGSVDVLDVASGTIRRIEGFPTQEMERNGKKRTVGPSSVTVGDSGMYVGSRGDFTVCAMDEVKLTRGTCGKLDSMPDGIAWVAKTKEVWVTTPRDKSLRMLDGTTLVQKARLEFDGEPEGFAVDAVRGRFYTNLEDKDLTLAIDLATHKTVATWKPGCGEDGPKGLRLVEPPGFLLVACANRVEVMDVAHDGAILGRIDTGDGVDDVEFSAAARLVYAGAARAAKLTIATLDAKGALSLLASVPTRDGARNGVVDDSGRVYLAHSKGSALLVVSPPAK